jgi:hypothetical protein
VYAIWWVTLAVTALGLVPLAVYLLHRTWRAARSIERYAADALAAAQGIAGNTQHIPALDATVGLGGDLLEAAGAAEQKLDTVARVLAGRAG